VFSRISSIALSALLLAAGTGDVFARSEFQALSGRVVDTAEILSDHEETRLSAMLGAHERATGGRVIVATVPDLGGRSIEAYGADLAHHWNIAMYPESAILIVAEAERRVRMEFGPPVRGTMIDVRSSQMVQRLILPAFRAGEFAIGLEAGLAELFLMLEEGVDQASDEARHLSELIVDKRAWLPVLLLLLVIALCSRGRCRRA